MNTLQPVKRKYLLKPDNPELIKLFSFRSFNIITPLPTSVDLRNKCPPIYDQGKLGSCTANGIGFAYHFDQLKQNEKVTTCPSRLFIYYNERVLEHTTYFDSGASILDGVMTIHNTGVVPETDWPYIINKFRTRPPTNLYKKAKSHISKKFSQLSQNLNQLKSCLAQGFPFVFGIMVYQSLENPDVDRTGIIPDPNTTHEVLLGGHCIACVGYDDSEQKFIIRNSWGTNWGMAGYGKISYNYVLDPKLSSSFWTITEVSDIGKY